MKPGVKIRIILILIVTLTLLAVGFSLFVHWPWLRAESDRLEPASRVLIWFGDVTALLWMIWFGIRYGLAGRSLPEAPLTLDDRERKYFLATLIVAFTLDAAITGLTAYDEASGKARALQVAGQIIEGESTKNEKKAYILCGFEDQNRKRYESHLQVSLTDQPSPVRDAILRGRYPLTVQVSYDPDWPQRCWLKGFDNQEDNRLHWMSAVFLVFQVLSIPYSLRFARWHVDSGWIPLYKIVPVWAELIPFFLAAGVKFFEGEF